MGAGAWCAGRSVLEALINRLHINAKLQTLRAGPFELLLVAVFGRSRIVATTEGVIELRKWRGRSYLWRWE